MHFHGVMPVVVDNQGFAALGQRDFAVALETPPYPTEGCQALLDGFHGGFAFERHADAGECVEHVVPPCAVEGYIKGLYAVGLFDVDGELHLCAVGAHVACPDVGGFIVDSVGGEGFLDFGQDGADVGTVYAKKGFAVEGHAVHEVYKCLAQFIGIVVVGVHMVFVDVGDDGEHGRQIEE